MICNVSFILDNVLVSLNSVIFGKNLIDNKCLRCNFDSKNNQIGVQQCALTILYYKVFPRGANDPGSARGLTTGDLRHWTKLAQNPLTTDKGQILLSENLLVPQFDYFRAQFPVHPSPNNP